MWQKKHLATVNMMVNLIFLKKGLRQVSLNSEVGFVGIQNSREHGPKIQIQWLYGVYYSEIIC